MQFLLLSALVAVALSQPLEVPLEDLEQWDMFKISHQKTYESKEEEEKRKAVFLNNLQFIREHNAKHESGEVTFNVNINKFADMTLNEFAQVMNGYRQPTGSSSSGQIFIAPENVELPKSVDWRKKGAVTPVKNQGCCGSCWAFGAVASLEGQHFLKTKKLVSLSEQNLLDCTSDEGNKGCHGGNRENAFHYIKNNNGIDTEASYPYAGYEDKCRYKSQNKGATINGIVNIPKGSEDALQCAVATQGPVSVGIDAKSLGFQFYRGGVYNNSDCSSTDIDHAVTVVGYSTAEKGGAYWLVKNSWGTDWGMEGYIMMARNNKNMCGIATSASYPIV